MTYKTYWSVLDSPAKSIRSYDIFMVIIVVALIAWILIKRFKKSNDDIEKTILLWFTGVLFLFSVAAYSYLKIYDKDESYKNTKELLESSQVGKVEGIITDFESINLASRRGVVRESFTVDSIDFSYSSELLGRFNHFGNTRNGVLRNGLPVRITYGKEQNEILKIEIDNNNYSP